MALAGASKRVPSAGLLKNLQRLAAPSSSLLAPASSVAATGRLYSTGYYYYAPPSIGSTGYYYYVAPYNHQLLALHPMFHPMYFTPTHFFHPIFFTTAAPVGMWWVSKEDVDAVEVTMSMLGLPKERVKAWMNKKGLYGAAVQEPAPYSYHV